MARRGDGDRNHDKDGSASNGPGSDSSTRISGTARMSLPKEDLCEAVSAMAESASVTMSGGMRAAATRTPLMAAPESSARGAQQRAPRKRPPIRPGSCRRFPPAEPDMRSMTWADAIERRQDSANGKIDPTGDDHERLPDRQNEKNRRIDGEHRTD